MWHVDFRLQFSRKSSLTTSSANLFWLLGVKVVQPSVVKTDQTECRYQSQKLLHTACTLGTLTNSFVNDNVRKGAM